MSREQIIEVEGRYHADQDSKARVLEGAKFVEQIRRTDVYYDTAGLALAKKGIYIINKNGEFELKSPKNADDARKGSGFIEPEHPEMIIRALLRFPLTGKLADSLQQHGYAPFCTFDLTRNRYKSGNLRIDIDEAVFPTFGYEVIEVEAKVPESTESKTERAIQEFAEKHNLRLARGKLFQFLHKTRRQDYETLCSILGIDDSIF